MLNLLGWDVGMSAFAAILLVAGALLVGIIAHFIGEVTVPYEWAVTGIAALVGGYLGSEAFAGLSTWGPAFEGLYIVPAIIGGLILGGVVDALTRYATAGSYIGHPRPI